MDWAAELAVPGGDGAVDLASFEAPPQPDEQPAARDRTAMWGLAPSPGAAAASRVLAASPPPQEDPWDSPAASDEASLSPQEHELQPPAPANGSGPFDLGALEPAEEPLPLALLELAPAEAEVLEATEEVGYEVTEVAPAEEPAFAAAEVAEPALAPAAETHPAEPPQPEPFPARVEPVTPAPTEPVTAAAAEPTPTPLSSYITGPHRVVIHTADGQVKRGTVCDVALDGPELLLQPQAGGAPETLQAERVKAIFFMLGAGEAPPEPAGQKVRVTFRDGRQVAGFSPDYRPELPGFFMIPVDTRTHTARIWVYRTSVRQVTIS